MKEEIRVLTNILKLNTKLCKNCFEGIDEEAALKRINSSSNSMNFILLHMLDARYYIAKFAGVHCTSPYKEKLKDIKNINDYKDPIKTGELLEYWNEISGLLHDALINCDEEELSKESRLKFPVDDKTKLGGITFFVQHDSYHLGQLALLRKELGFNAMSYE